MSEIKIIRDQISAAVCPEDFFGKEIGSTPDKTLHRLYLQFSKAVHPDRHGSSTEAKDAFAELGDIYHEASERIKAGTWGKMLPLPGKEKVTIADKYERIRTLVVGDIADVHIGKYAAKTVLIKAVRHPKDNDLAAAEQKNLGIVRKKMASKGSVWLQCIPDIIDSVLIGEGIATRRRVNIVEAYPGFLTAEEIRKRVPGGIDGRTLVWMWKRLMVLLDWTYRSGVIHGAILPPHVMFYPDNDGFSTKDPRKHAVRLIDWCYSIEHAKRSRLSGWVPQYADFYAPEIVAKKILTANTDLYMAAKTMIFLSGGDVVKNTIGAHIPAPIAEHVLACVHQDPGKRPQSAGNHFETMLSIQTTVFGKPQWHDFSVPGGPGTKLAV